ncbi:hypothetical protein PENSPDRAFT_659123 [Peniophora sp. CONT]|nr:hypothetical protein PENSPDRAFT_659123 [Peniophora sp. CONT]
MDDFDALPKNTREKIDRAFDKASSSYSNSVPSADHNSYAGGFIVDDAPAPGGFLLDDAPGGFLPPDAGGFLPPSPPSGGFLSPSPPAGGFLPSSPPPRAARIRSPDDFITLSEITRALQILDLPPDDEEVLAVFRNAATGWGAREKGDEEGEPEETVTRKDWRAVCSALIGDDDEPGDAEMDEPEDVVETIDDEDVSMEIQESEGDASSDEYVEETPQPKRKRGAATKTPARKTRQKKAERADSDSDGDPLNRLLTARQKRECLHAFSLFFPGLEEDAVKRRRIGIKEITQASNILKEKTNVEEMVEMLEAFSSTPDKTMSLSDFEKMMITTRMV